MNPYEGMFVLFNKEAQKTHDYLEEHVQQLVRKVGARMVRMKKWDERQLAYEIQGQRDGIFYLAYFEAEGDSITRLRREAELSELVLRLLILRLDKVPDEEEEQPEAAEAFSGDSEASAEEAPAASMEESAR